MGYVPAWQIGHLSAISCVAVHNPMWHRATRQLRLLLVRTQDISVF